AGAILTLLGIILSDPIRFGLVKLSAGWLNTGGVNRATMVGLEIGSLAALFGGILAAVATGAGLKHGFFAGILASVGLLIASTGRANGLFPAVEGYLNLFAVDHHPLTSPRIAVNVTLGLVVFMTLAG